VGGSSRAVFKRGCGGCGGVTVWCVRVRALWWVRRVMRLVGRCGGCVRAGGAGEKSRVCSFARLRQRPAALVALLSEDAPRGVVAHALCRPRTPSAAAPHAHTLQRTPARTHTQHTLTTPATPLHTARPPRTPRPRPTCVDDGGTQRTSSQRGWQQQRRQAQRSTVEAGRVRNCCFECARCVAHQTRCVHPTSRAHMRAQCVIASMCRPCYV
jgi:hypothetical protein